MVVGKIAEGIIRYGLGKAPGIIRQLQRTDVRIHKSLYGSSGGRGVRHGRDIGSLVGSAVGLGGSRGDDLENAKIPERPRAPSRKFNKTYRRFGFKRSNKRCYCPPRNRR